MYSMVTIVNNTVVHLKIKRVDLKSSHHEKKNNAILEIVLFDVFETKCDLLDYLRCSLVN